jgi:hypothetical protein
VDSHRDDQSSSDALAQLLFAMNVASISPIARQSRIESPQMSHFTTIKTKIHDKDLLKKSLEGMGINSVVVAEETNSLPVRGYEGQSQTADIVVQQNNGYDIGFRWNGNEYELVSDLQFWEQKMPQDLFMEKLLQQYSLNNVMDSAESVGMKIDAVVRDETGDIKVTASTFK